MAKKVNRAYNREPVSLCLFLYIIYLISLKSIILQSHSILNHYIHQSHSIPNQYSQITYDSTSSLAYDILCYTIIHQSQTLAAGDDVSDLFAAVVKNVVSKNIEVFHFSIENTVKLLFIRDI